MSILTLYRMRMQGYCNVYKCSILKRTSPEVKCLHLTSSKREMCTSSVSNVIFHKFSHCAVSYTLNGETLTSCLEYEMPVWMSLFLKLFEHTLYMSSAKKNGCDFEYSNIHLGPVVQSIVILTSSLRGQLLKCFMTL